jgi:hypothetical protein
MPKTRTERRVDQYGYVHEVEAPDPLYVLECEQAEATRRWVQAQGLDKPLPPRPLPAGVVMTAPLAPYLKQLTAWPPWRSVCRLVLTVCPLEQLPELRDRLTPDDAYQLDGTPVVCLGECKIVARDLKGIMTIAYEPMEFYAIERALTMTRALRDEQLEREHTAAGPGKRHHALAQEVAHLKEGRP